MKLQKFPDYFVKKSVLRKPALSTVKLPEALAIIRAFNLKPHRDFWHFGYHLELLESPFNLLRQGEELYLYPNETIDRWSPLPIFTNSRNKQVPEQIRDFKRCILKTVSKDKIQSDRKYFWWTKTQDFSAFLTHRDQISHKAKANFPSTYTYARVKAKLAVEFSIIPWNQNFFIEHYDNLKRPEHSSADQTHLPAVPQDWLKLVCLIKSDLVVAIALIIDDQKSICASNMASQRISGRAGYGVFLCTELFKYCCEHGYHSCNAGISGVYGGYKNKIFQAYQVC